MYNAQADVAHPEAGNEDLRAQINSLKYELENVQQERSLLTLQYEKELRDVQMKADADYKKFQVSITSTVLSDGSDK
jgi:mitotic spindle assembly checkpoint protein MAD1